MTVAAHARADRPNSHIIVHSSAEPLCLCVRWRMLKSIEKIVGKIDIENMITCPLTVAESIRQYERHTAC